MHFTKLNSSLVMLIAGLLFFCSACERFIPPAQQGNFFVKLFGGRDPDQGADILRLPNQGGYLLLGTTNSLGGTDADILLIQTDLEGNQTSELNLNTGIDQGRSLTERKDGNGYIIGVSTISLGNQDAWVASIDWNSLNPNWSVTVGFPDGMESITQVLSTEDQHILVLGSTTKVDPSKNGGNGQALATDNSDIWLVKLDLQGQTIWQKRYGFNGFDAGIAIREHQGEYYLLGTTDNPSPDPGLNSPLLIRLNAEGNIIDRMILEASSAALVPADFVIEDDGDWVVLSTLFEGEAQPNLQRVSRDLKTVELIDLHTSESWAEARKLIQLENGYMIGAIQRSTNNAPADIIVQRHNANGDSLWFNRFGYTGADDFGNIIWLGDESFLLSGTLEFDNNNSMACLIRTQQDAAGRVGP